MGGAVGATEHAIDWRANDWTPASDAPPPPQRPVHTPASQCPSIAPEWEDPNGVPISAILFGGRRATSVPLVTESFDWTHGVFLGSIMSSEKTAAAAGNVGELRFDPFAMLPFCGYNMGDYFALAGDRRGHGRRQAAGSSGSNWFRRGEDGSFLGPVSGTTAGCSPGSSSGSWARRRSTPHRPCPGTRRHRPHRTGHRRRDAGQPAGCRRSEVVAPGAVQLDEHYCGLGDHVPAELREQLTQLEKRLAAG